MSNPVLQDCVAKRLLSRFLPDHFFKGLGTPLSGDDLVAHMGIGKRLRTLQRFSKQ
jgi:hypothetical protein